MSARPSRVVQRTSSGRADLRVVKRRSRKLIRRSPSTRATPLVIAGVILAVAAVFGILLEQVLMAQSAFKLGRIRERMIAAEARHEDLIFQVSQLQSDARIESYARTQLGMVEADPARTEFIVADLQSRRDRQLATASGGLRPRARAGQAVGLERGP
jgi:cell division protein FtsL